MCIWVGAEKSSTQTIFQSLIKIEGIWILLFIAFLLGAKNFLFTLCVMGETFYLINQREKHKTIFDWRTVWIINTKEATYFNIHVVTWIVVENPLQVVKDIKICNSIFCVCNDPFQYLKLKNDRQKLFLH